MKKILYLDMDGVLADFDAGIKKIDPEIDNYPKSIKSDIIDRIIKNDSQFFNNLLPIKDAIESVNNLFDIYDVYFLSTPMWSVPESFTGKRIWLEKMFGNKCKKRLILTHRKDLNIGDFLVDDRLKNGADKFSGELILFGSGSYTNWNKVFQYLISKANS
jgi:5'-nucleotidase